MRLILTASKSEPKTRKKPKTKKVTGIVEQKQLREKIISSSPAESQKVIMNGTFHENIN